MINLQMTIVDALYGGYAFWHFRIKDFRVFYWLILFLSNPVHTIFTRNSECVLHLEIYSVTVSLIPPAPSVDPHSCPTWKLASPSLAFPDSLWKHENMVPCLHVPRISSSHCCFYQPQTCFHFVCDLSNWVLISPCPLPSSSVALGTYSGGSLLLWIAGFSTTLSVPSPSISAGPCTSPLLFLEFQHSLSFSAY